MKYIFLNTKRFDITPEKGGVNRLSPINSWGATMIRSIQDHLKRIDCHSIAFTVFLPEAHLICAAEALDENSPLKIGCQGVYRQDTAIGGNFGAFTSNRTANAAKELGCESVIIGHCEERNDKAGILAEAKVTDSAAVNRILNAEIIAAQNANLSVLYCIGEKEDEMDNWQSVLGAQLDIGLDQIQKENVVIAYEPVWSIGPGKTPADKDYIAKVARFVKERTDGLAVIYGGGLKLDNARMLANIAEIDGGLVALTRFTGEIGFYPEEFCAIVKAYMQI